MKKVAHNSIDLSSCRFGRLTVYNRVSKDKWGQWLWFCKCDCGGTKITAGGRLRSGHVKSCGCLQREAAAKILFKDGMSQSPLYSIRQDMIRRCYNPNRKDYLRYGGRGITVCKEWRLSASAFYNWALSNGYKTGLTIDRIDNTGPYSPSNCRWATNKEQQNNKRSNKLICFKGETKTLTQWGKDLNIPITTLHSRLKYYQWSEERALTTPVKNKKKQIKG